MNNFYVHKGFRIDGKYQRITNLFIHQNVNLDRKVARTSGQIFYHTGQEELLTMAP